MLDHSGCASYLDSDSDDKQCVLARRWLGSLGSSSLDGFIKSRRHGKMGWDSVSRLGCLRHSVNLATVKILMFE